MNFIENHERTKRLNDLSAEWIVAKVHENAANKIRLDIEKQILDLTGTADYESGTFMVDNGVNITFGKTSKLDEDFLWRNIKLLKDLGELSPFSYSFKEDKKKMSALAVIDKPIYDILQKAVKSKQKKPSFSLITKK